MVPQLSKRFKKKSLCSFSIILNGQNKMLLSIRIKPGNMTNVPRNISAYTLVCVSQTCDCDDKCLASLRLWALKSYA